MYRKIYGEPRNHWHQKALINRERSARHRRAAHNSSRNTTMLSSTPTRYSLRDKEKVRSYERDARIWERSLNEERRENFARVMQEMKERERARIAAAELEKIKKELLVVEDVDVHIKENTEAHRTDLFECTERDQDPQLVVRRGQEFKMTFTFQRPWSNKVDDMYLVFKIGEEPNPFKGTYAKIKLEEGNDTSYMTDEEKEWGARIEEKEGNKLTVAVYPPPDAIIGEWEYAVRTVKTETNEQFECEGDDDIIILLNPWCSDDQVFMRQTQDLQEYVLNESGLVFSGSAKRIRSKPWNYQQFQEGILEASLHILRKSNDFAVSSKMGDAVYIARSLSRVINSCDDNGILTGRWDGNYEDGVRPLSWKGSAPIIEEYMKTGQPVKYGQCWVFSHLFTTIARALGLPMRSVTNFSSAHDTDLTMTIDKYVDEDGDEIDFKNNDSVWNFHVWNESWILRRDLDKLTKERCQYDGWHAVDATPQELSDSVFQCGPSPLAAIRDGDVHIGFDTKFIFGEVNSEYCTWENGDPPTLISRNTNRVGRYISTKWPNGSSCSRYSGIDRGVRLDVTDLYKYPEGSVGERETVEKATRQGKFGKQLFERKCGVSLEVEEVGDTIVGDDLTLKVTAKNESSEDRTVKICVTVRPTNYGGGFRGRRKMACETRNETVGAGQSFDFEVQVKAEDYMKACDDGLCMKVMAIGKVVGSDQPIYASEDIVIDHPDLEVTRSVQTPVERGEPFEVEISFKNPLTNQKLTGVELQVEGSVEVLDKDFVRTRNAVFINYLGEVAAGEEKTMKVSVKAAEKPRRSRDREMEVGLVCKELPDMEGSLAIKLES